MKFEKEKKQMQMETNLEKSFVFFSVNTENVGKFRMKKILL